jgi:glycosyltransferase involved in cell wall biosynthesis
MQYLVRKTLLQVDAILVLGEGLREMYDFEPALRDKIYVVPNGLPVEFGGVSKFLPAAGEPVNILYLSNLIESKGVFDLLAAIRQLKYQYGIPVSAVFAGKFLASSDDQLVSSAADVESHFFSLLKRYQIEECVQYVGEVSGDAKWQLLEKSHFFVLPTNYVNEGQPVSIIEAMAYGCPVITTRFRAIPDLVVDGETGVLVKYGDVDKLSLRLSELAKDQERYQVMSKAAMRRFQSKFTMRAHLDRILPMLLAAEDG